MSHAAKPDDDYYSQSLATHAWREAKTRDGPRSSSWSKRRWKAGPSQVAPDLRALQSAGRSFARVLGAPPNTSVSFARVGQRGAAATGFHDAPKSFEKPFVLLDKLAYLQSGPDEVLDVFCGIVFHEVGHVRETRDGFRRLTKDTPQQIQIYNNLWEDERVEAIQESRYPGFAPFLQVAKHVLLERGSCAAPLANFADLPDLDKVELLIFTFVRLAHRIDEPMREWRAINGECVFETLRRLFPVGPRDESGVEAYANALRDLIERLRLHYERDEPSPTPDADQRRSRQREADAEDRALGPRPDREKSSRSKIASGEASSLADRLFDESASLEEAGDAQVAERLLERAVEAVIMGEDRFLQARAGRRFGWTEVERASGAFSIARETLTRKETATIVRMDRERTIEGDAWDWGGDRATRIIRPEPSADQRKRYEQARESIKPHLSAMRNVFAVRHGERVRVDREQESGRLDRRRLAWATATKRLYVRPRIVSSPGLALCLLLDESGSMSQGIPPRAEVTLNATVLITEALRGVPAVELEVYSHSSFGDSDRDCLVRHLHGRGDTDPSPIGVYGPKSQNYDHQAILTVARQFERRTKQPTKVMLVLSDGLPSGHGYDGEPAIRATRKAVETVRRRGVRIMGITIGDQDGELIFGRRDHMRFTDMSRLVSDMRALVTSIVRETTEGA